MITRIDLVHGTVGELRRILNRQGIRDDTAISLSVVGFVGFDSPGADPYGYDEMRTPCKKVTLIERPGTVQPQHIRLST